LASNGVAAEKFVTERDRYNDLYAQHTKAHKKTASQQKNWVEWPAFQAMVRDMAQDVSDMKGARAWSAPELMRYQDYVLALLYSHYPLHNDFGDVKILSKMGFKRLSGADKAQQNYLVKTDNQMFLVLNEYKTFDVSPNSSRLTRFRRVRRVNWAASTMTPRGLNTSQLTVVSVLIYDYEAWVLNEALLHIWEYTRGSMPLGLARCRRDGSWAQQCKNCVNKPYLNRTGNS
jgi:hypothetical protein